MAVGNGSEMLETMLSAKPTTANPPILGAEAHSIGRYPAIPLIIVTIMTTLAGLVLFRFDPNRYPFYPVCAFHHATGLLCPGCGSLRAIHQLLHGHLATAFRFNPLLILALPFLAAYAAMGNGRTPSERGGSAIRFRWWCLFLIIALGFTFWRNIPGSMFNALPQ